MAGRLPFDGASMSLFGMWSCSCPPNYVPHDHRDGVPAVLRYGPRTVFQRGMHGIPQCVLRPALDAYAETSSTGMTQKLYLTGLLLQDNAVLLLEEQSSSLDFRLSKVCFDAVHGDHYSEGAPYLMPLARREAPAGLC